MIKLGLSIDDDDMLGSTLRDEASKMEGVQLRRSSRITCRRPRWPFSLHVAAFFALFGAQFFGPRWHTVLLCVVEGPRGRGQCTGTGPCKLASVSCIVESLWLNTFPRQSASKPHAPQHTHTESALLLHLRGTWALRNRTRSLLGSQRRRHVNE